MATKEGNEILAKLAAEQALEHQIDLADQALNQALGNACEAMEACHVLRDGVTNEGMRRRGWGIAPEQERLLKLLYAIKHHATEQGGGVTTEEQHALDAALECF